MADAQKKQDDDQSLKISPSIIPMPMQNYRALAFKQSRIFEESVCGNNIIERDEKCDDGNLVSGDGCDSECGISTICGDRKVEEPETCDDGNSVSGDGCNAKCYSEENCGNGDIETGEECDDGNKTAGDGCDAGCLTEAVCGNNQIEGDEQCDDGNSAPGDGCTAACLFESLCGNGQVEGGEECDDGNTQSGDGCANNCIAEAVCGNRVVQAPETCDDGNSANGDGCSSACQIEPRCGDGIRNGAEQCEFDDQCGFNETCSDCSCVAVDTCSSYSLTVSGGGALQVGQSMTITADTTCASGGSGEAEYESGGVFDWFSGVAWADTPSYSITKANKIINDCRKDEYYAWSASGQGSVSMSGGSKSATITCTAPGQVTISVAGPCPNTGANVTVTCIDPNQGGQPDITCGSGFECILNGTPRSDGGGACPTEAPTIPQGHEIVLSGNNCTEMGRICSGQCVGTQPIPSCRADADCNDNLLCTTDRCTAGNCQFDFNTNACDDNKSCTTGDRCSSGICVGSLTAGCCTVGTYFCAGACIPLSTPCSTGPVCGNGLKEFPPELCEANSHCATGEMCNNCSCVPDVNPVCGDGVSQSPFEECDDGNKTSGDGCSSSCKVEAKDPPQAVNGCSISISGGGSVYVGQTTTISGSTTCTANTQCPSQDSYTWNVSNANVAVSQSGGTSVTVTCMQVGTTSIGVSDASCSHQTSSEVTVNCQATGGVTCADYNLMSQASQCFNMGCYKEEVITIAGKPNMTCYSCQPFIMPSNCCSGSAVKANVAEGQTCANVTGAGCKSGTQTCTSVCPTGTVSARPTMPSVQYECCSCSSFDSGHCSLGGQSKGLACFSDVRYQAVTYNADSCSGIAVGGGGTCMPQCESEPLDCGA